MLEYGSSLFYGQSKDFSKMSHLYNIPPIGFLTLPENIDVDFKFHQGVSKDSLKNDLIVLAEFSEVEGPIPRLCIPCNSSHDLDLNDFVLHMLSTDYQNLGNMDFQIYKDTCLMQEDRWRGIFSYIHYFTLFDVRARGFVRPMCLAYITGESAKLPKLLQMSLKEEFFNVTEFLRVGNLVIFENEVKKRISDLLYTKDKYIEWSRYWNSLNPKDKLDAPLNIVGRETELNALSRSLSDKKDLEIIGLNDFHGSFFQKIHTTPVPTDDGPSRQVSSSLRPLPVSLSYVESDFSSSLPALTPVVTDAVTHSDIFQESLRLYSQHRATIDNAEEPPVSSRESTCIREILAVESRSDSFSTTQSESGDMVKEDANQHRVIIDSVNSPAEYAVSGRDSTCVGEVMAEESRSDSFSTTQSEAGDVLKEHEGLENREEFEGLENREDISSLEHTSLDALASQILDCQRILAAVSAYLDRNDTKEWLSVFFDDIKTEEFPLLREELQSMGFLSEDLAEDNPTPSIFVISLMRRIFRNMRSFASLCGLGYVVGVAKLLHIYSSFSKSLMTLVFEELDGQVDDNLYPSGSLFVGNVPLFSFAQYTSDSREGSCSQVNVSDSNCRERKMSFMNIFRNNMNGLIKTLKYDQNKSSASPSKLANDQENLSPLLGNSTQPELSSSNSNDSSSQHRVSGIISDENSGSCPENAINEKLENINDPHRASATPFLESKDDERGNIATRIGRLSVSSASSFGSLTNESEGGHSLNEVAIEEKESPSRPQITPATRRDIDWRMSDAKSYRLSAFLRKFSGASHCIMAAILAGKTVLIAGPEWLKTSVMMFAKSLSSLIPRRSRDRAALLKWHTGTIIEWHLDTYKIIGVCIPERLHVQDLMSNATLNRVTVLNIETGHVSGVAYTGVLLQRTDPIFRKQFRSEATLQTVLQDTLVSLGRDAFLFFHLTRTTTRKPTSILKAMGVHRGDWEILIYLVQLINRS